MGWVSWEAMISPLACIVFLDCLMVPQPKTHDKKPEECVAVHSHQPKSRLLCHSQNKTKKKQQKNKKTTNKQTNKKKQNKKNNECVAVPQPKRPTSALRCRVLHI